jgi:hypothetical protein
MTFLRRALAGAGLALAALTLSAPAALACPNWTTQRTAFGGGQLTAGFTPDPVEVPRITAGGRHYLGDCFPETNFTGFVISRPDYRLQYYGTSPTGYLKFTLVSNATDTVLLINAPDGLYYFDDDIDYANGNTNSSILFSNPLPGQYDIWAGSFRPSSNNPARLFISEYP